jgi:uncharacterized SAM-binding protein YcdF (DUF218 family)
MTAREQFCAALFTGPLLRGDAVVLLTGDGETRVATAAELFRQNAAPLILVTGGLHEPPYALDAKTTAGKLMALGVAPRAIEADMTAMNTREQAVHTVAQAVERGWGRLLLVASPYHAPRAFLTFLRALQEAGVTDTVHLLVVPTSEQPWFKRPEGRDETRLALLADEFEKVERYADHVATWDDGLAYLEAWESR